MNNPFREPGREDIELKLAQIREDGETRRKLIEEREATKRKRLETMGDGIVLWRVVAVLGLTSSTITGMVIHAPPTPINAAPPSKCVDAVFAAPAQCSHPDAVGRVEDGRLFCQCPRSAL